MRREVSEEDYYVGMGLDETDFYIGSTGCFQDIMGRYKRLYMLGGEVYHYRDKSGLECDAVVHLRNGSYGLAEIKLGGDEAIAHGAETLMELKNKIDTNKMKAPSFLMVLTGTGNYAYRREDGIYIVPIGCLRD